MQGEGEGKGAMPGEKLRVARHRVDMDFLVWIDWKMNGVMMMNFYKSETV